MNGNGKCSFKTRNFISDKSVKKMQVHWQVVCVLCFLITTSVIGSIVTQITLYNWHACFDKYAQNLLWYVFLLITLDSSNYQDSFKLTMISSFSAYRQLCPPGCTSCSAINGCITCQPNLFLFLARSGMRQQGICTHSCPTGYYGVRRHNYSICYSESIPCNGDLRSVSYTHENWP